MKTEQSIVSVALLSSLTLIAGVVFAADPEYPTNPERSVITDSPPAAKTEAEVRVELDGYRLNSVAPDGWLDVGGERGDALLPPQYRFEDGKLVRSDKVDYSAGSPSRIWTAADQTMASLYYRNTQ